MDNISKAGQLYLRLGIHEVPKCCLLHGNLLDAAAGLWCFDVAENGLRGLLAELCRTMPQSVGSEIQVLWLCNAEGALSPLEALSHVVSLETLYTWVEHEWIKGDLGDSLFSLLQPIVDLQSGGRLFAYEALCRVRTGENEVIGAIEAFDVARRAKRLEAMDVAAQLAAIEAKILLMPAGMPLFINAMPCSLVQADYDRHPLFAALRARGVPAQEIVVEIVESERFEDVEVLALACDALRAQGVRIALDDMGSGYNGLSLLGALRPDFVKIDRDLVHGAHNSRVRSVMLEAIISLAQRLGCATVVEGLEDEQDVQLCCDLGVSYAQGYFFAPPDEKPVAEGQLPTVAAARTVSPVPQVRLGDFLVTGSVVSVHDGIHAAQRRFRSDTALEFIVVLDDERPVGYLDRKLLRCVGRGNVGRYAKALEHILGATANAHSLFRRLYENGGRNQPWVVTDDAGRYMGTLALLGALDHLTKAGVPSSVHPLTNLPTGPVLRSLIDHRLAGEEWLHLIYLDLDHFKAFNDRYGFVRGDAMIYLLAEILRKTAAALPGVELGHIGGDDFLMVAPASTHGEVEEALEWLITRFHELAIYLYDQHDFQRGYFSTESGGRYPVATLSVAVITGAEVRVTDSVGASARAAQLKRLGKDRQGSVIVVEGKPPHMVPRAGIDGLPAWHAHLERALRSFPALASGQAVDAWFADHPEFELVFRVDSEGMQCGVNWVNPAMRGSIKRGGVGVYRGDRPYFTMLRPGCAAYLSSVYLSRATEDFCLTFCCPVWDADNVLQELWLGDIGLRSLVG
jgi:EAL domain-containing protein (putative c-di-GMP-specific phosphodiesterase class I)/GGDEF domain-containing protein